ETTIEYDQPFNVLTAAVTDPARLTARAVYNYRVMQPGLLTDTNDNRTQIDFSPLGMVSAVWLIGKRGQGEGDATLPSTSFQYDFRVVLDSRRVDPNALEPIYVKTVRRTHHDSD